MTSTVRIRGEVPFPIAGEGVVLRFTNPDCDALQKEFGDNWFGDCVPRINRFDMHYLRVCVDLGAKQDGKRVKVDFDGLDCPVGEIAEAVLDGLFLAMQGRTFDNHLAYLDSLRSLATKDDEGNV